MAKDWRDKHRGYQYEIATRDLGRGPEHCFLIRCRCGRWQYGGNRNDIRLAPEGVLPIFRKLGWLIGKKNGHGNKCPECQMHPETTKEIATMRTIKSLQELGPQLVKKAHTAALPNGALNGAVHTSAHVIDVTPIPASEPAPPAPAAPQLSFTVEPPATAAQEPRALTVSEIIAVTRALDENFDEKIGAYIKDWSDEKIATKTNVPRAYVIKMREEGSWGKIRVFSDVEIIKNDIRDMRAMLKDIETRVLDVERKRIAAK